MGTKTTKEEGSKQKIMQNVVVEMWGATGTVEDIHIYIYTNM